MKKTLSLVIAVVMAISLCSFTAVAAETIEFDDISNGQLKDFIVSDLADLGVYQVESSNEDVINIYGEVTRPLLEDEKVTLNVDGNEFEVTVKAQTTEVLYQNNFNKAIGGAEYDETIEIVGSTVNNTQVEGWRFINYTQQETLSSKLGATGGIEFDLTTYGQQPSYVFSEPMTTPFYFQLDAMAELTDPGIEIRISYKANAEDTKDEVFTIYRLETANTTRLFGQYPSNLQSGGANFPSTSENKNTLRAYVDPVTMTVKAGDAKGVMMPAAGKAIGEGLSNGLITSIRVTRSGSSYPGGSVEIDNFIITQEKSAEDALANASEEERFNYLKSFLEASSVANGESLASVTKDLTFAPDDIDLSVLDSTLEWTTSNEEVIAQDGTITRDALVPKSATITGTLTVGDTYSLSKTYTVKVAPEGTEMFVGPNYSEDFNWDFEDAEAGTTITSGGAVGYPGTRGINHSGTITYVNDENRGMIAEHTGGNFAFYSGVRSGNYSSRYLAGMDYKFTVPEGDGGYSVAYYLRGNNSGQTVVKIGKEAGVKGSKYVLFGQPHGGKEDSPDNAVVNGVSYKVSTNQIWNDKVEGLENIQAPDVWHSIDIDYNAMGNVFLVYIDGVLLTHIPASTQQTTGSSMMWIQVETTGLTSLQMDNQYVVSYTDADVVKADAALKSAVWEAGGRETGQNSRPGAYRIIDRKERDSVVIGEISTPAAMYESALTWEINGKAHTDAVIPAATKADTKHINLSATSGEVTLTTSFATRTAPAEIQTFGYEMVQEESGEVAYVSKITIEGSLKGKTVIAVSRDEDTGMITDIAYIPVTTDDTTITFAPEDYIPYQNPHFYVFDAQAEPYVYKR